MEPPARRPSRLARMHARASLTWSALRRPLPDVLTWSGMVHGSILDCDGTAINRFKNPRNAFRGPIRRIVHLHEAYSYAVPPRLVDDQIREVEVRSVSIGAGAGRRARPMSRFRERVCGIGNPSAKPVMNNFTRVVDERCHSPCLGKFRENARVAAQPGCKRRKQRNPWANLLRRLNRKSKHFG
jgi:hypothetical protein